jgi:hypothetical protein
MNVETEKLIALTVEGLESENGHVRADEFIDKLTHFLTALNGIDRLVGQSGSPSLYYRIVGAVHNGTPLKFTLEPVLRKNTKKADKDHLQNFHKRFFREVDAIKRMEPVSPDVEDRLLEHLLDITSGIGESFKSATISNGKEQVELDRNFEKNLRKLIEEEDVSYGSIEGKLDAVNLHERTRRFWIYPKIGPDRVRCDFLPGTFDQIKEALGHRVRVIGQKFFRPPSPYPFRINVKDFEKLSDEKIVSIKDLGGIAPDATGEMSSVEFVRKIRNEWR